MVINSASANPPPALPRNLESLQVLRGFAALLVVMIHVSGTIEHRFGIKLLPGFVDAGMIGVDIFFCLSGFIMYYTANAGFGLPGESRRFLLRRFFRIYPVYWVVTAITLAVGLWETRVMGGYGLSWLSAFKSVLLLPQNTSPIVGQGWTLVHEVRFYATFGLLLLLPRLWALRGMIAWGVLSFGVLLLSYRDTDWLNGSLLGRGVNYLFHPGSMEFVLGVGAAWIVLHRKTTSVFDAVVLAAGVIGTLVVVQWFGLLKPDTKYFAITLFAVPSFLLVLGSTLAERRWLPKVPRLAVTLGDASYSTYLTHILVLEPFVWHALPANTGKTGLVIIAWLLVIVLHVVGVGFYLWIEGPLHQRARVWTKRLVG